MARCQRPQWDGRKCDNDAVSRFLVIPHNVCLGVQSEHLNQRKMIWLCSPCSGELYHAEKRALAFPTPDATRPVS